MPDLNYEQLIRDTASEEGFDPDLAVEIGRRENQFKPRGVSTAGAQGLMQMLPGTFRQYADPGADINDPKANARASIRYLKFLNNRYGGDVDKTLAGYNWGEGNLDNHGLAKAPKETRNYIATIKPRYERAQLLKEGDELLGNTSASPAQTSTVKPPATASRPSTQPPDSISALLQEGDELLGSAPAPTAAVQPKDDIQSLIDEGDQLLGNAPPAQTNQKFYLDEQGNWKQGQVSGAQMPAKNLDDLFFRSGGTVAELKAYKQRYGHHPYAELVSAIDPQAIFPGLQAQVQNHLNAMRGPERAAGAKYEGNYGTDISSAIGLTPQQVGAFGAEAVKHATFGNVDLGEYQPTANTGGTLTGEIFTPENVGAVTGDVLGLLGISAVLPGAVAKASPAIRNAVLFGLQSAAQNPDPEGKMSLRENATQRALAAIKGGVTGAVIGKVAGNAPGLGREVAAFAGVPAAEAAARTLYQGGNLSQAGQAAAGAALPNVGFVVGGKAFGLLGRPGTERTAEAPPTPTEQATTEPSPAIPASPEATQPRPAPFQRPGGLTRAEFQRKATAAFGNDVSPEELAANFAHYDALAQTYAKRYGGTVDDWYRNFIADVTPNEGVVKRQQPVAAQPTTPDVQPVVAGERVARTVVEQPTSLPFEQPQTPSMPPPLESQQLSPEVAALRAERDRIIQNIKSDTNLPYDEKGKQIKGVAMRYAAQERQLTGNLTAIEQAAQTKREASNYRGKPVSVAGVNGVVEGTAFGRVKVRLADRGTVNVEAEKVSPPIEQPPQTPPILERPQPIRPPERVDTPFTEVMRPPIEQVYPPTPERAAPQTTPTSEAIRPPIEPVVAQKPAAPILTRPKPARTKKVAPAVEEPAAPLPSDPKSVLMRQIDNEYVDLANRSRFMNAGQGLAVGGEGSRAFIKADVVRDYLANIRKGMTPEEAEAATKQYAREAIAKNNRKRPNDINWAIADMSYDAQIENLARRFRAIEPKAVAATQGPTEEVPYKKPSYEQSLPRINDGNWMDIKFVVDRAVEFGVPRDRVMRDLQERGVDYKTALYETQYMQGEPAKRTRAKREPDQVIATEKTPGGSALDYAIRPFSNTDGRKGYRVEIRMQGSTGDWESAGMGGWSANYEGAARKLGEGLARTNNEHDITDPAVQKYHDDLIALREEKQKAEAETKRRAEAEQNRTNAYFTDLAEKASQMKGKRGTITRQVSDAGKAQGALPEVAGTVYGDLAVIKEGKDDYNITHVKTGFKIADADSIGQAKQIIYRLNNEGLDWNFTDPGKVPKVNIQNAPRIVKEVKNRIAPESFKPPNELFQRAKASTHFLATGQAVIRAFSSPDVSTLSHEAWHIAERTLDDSDLAVLEKWAGLNPGELKDLQAKFDSRTATASEEARYRKAAEQFARGGEKYLSEGKAPTPALETVFAKFKEWLANLWRGVKNSPVNVKITPEARALYDRLLEGYEGEPQRANVSDNILQGQAGIIPSADTTGTATGVPGGPTAPSGNNPRIERPMQSVSGSADVNTAPRSAVRATPESARPYLPPELEKIIPKQEYNRLTTEESFAQARQIADSDPSRALSMALGNKSGPIENAAAMEMFKRATERGDFAQAKQIMDALAPRLTEAGQGIQIMSAISRISPDGAVMYADSVIRKSADSIPEATRNQATKLAKDINASIASGKLTPEMLNQLFQSAGQKVTPAAAKKVIDISNDPKLSPAQREQSINSFVANRFKIPSLSPATAQEIYKMAQDAAQLTGNDQNVARALMMKRIGLETNPKAGIGAKINEVVGLGKLLSPRTIANFFIRHGGFGLTEALADYPHAVIDRLTEGVTGKRTIYAPQIGQEVADFTSTLKQTAGNVLKGVRPGEDTATASITPSVLTSRVGKAAEGLHDILIGSTPVAQQVAFENQALRNIQRSKGGAALTPEDYREATRQSNEKTLRDQNTVNQLLGVIQRVPVIGRALVLFSRAPGSAFVRSLEYSPAGVVKAIYELGRPALTGKDFRQYDFGRAMTRGLIGTVGLMGLGLAASNAGLIIDAPEDSRAKALAATEGITGRRLNVTGLMRLLSGGNAALQSGDRLIKYAMYEPWAFPFDLAHNTLQAAKEGNRGAGAVVESFTKTVKEMPLVTGLAQKADQLLAKDEEGKGQTAGQGIKDLISNVPTLLIPTILNEGRGLLDKNVRETEASTLWQQTINKAMDQIPVASKRLPASLGPFGEPKQKQGIISRYQPTPEAQYGLDLFKQVGPTGHLPGVNFSPYLPRPSAPRTVSSTDAEGNKIERPASQQERTEMQQKRGPQAADLMRQVSSSAEFKQASPKAQAKILEEAQDAIGKGKAVPPLSILTHNAKVETEKESALAELKTNSTWQERYSTLSPEQKKHAVDEIADKYGKLKVKTSDKSTPEQLQRETELAGYALDHLTKYAIGGILTEARYWKPTK